MRLWVISIGILLMVISGDKRCIAEPNTGEQNPELPDPEEITGELLEEYDFSQIDQQLHRIAGMENFDFNECVKTLLQGDVGINSGNADGIAEYCYQVLLTELAANRTIMIKLLGLAIIMAMFTSLGKGTLHGNVSESGYYITYLLMIVLFLAAYRTMYVLTCQTFDDLLAIMYAIIPTYMAAVGYSNGITSAVVMEDSLLLGMAMISKAVKEVVFPLIHLFFSLGLMDQLMQREFFSHWQELLETTVKWLLKTVLAITVGLNTVKGMLAPAVDSVTATALQRGLQVIPGGDAASVMSGVMISSGILIKNAIGAGGICVLVMAVSVPVLKLSAMVLLYQWMGAMLQPIADRRMIRGIHTVGQSGRLLIAVLLAEITLLLLSLAIVASRTGGAIH